MSDRSRTLANNRFRSSETQQPKKKRPRVDAVHQPSDRWVNLKPFEINYFGSADVMKLISWSSTPSLHQPTCYFESWSLQRKQVAGNVIKIDYLVRIQDVNQRPTHKQWKRLWKWCNSWSKSSKRSNLKARGRNLLLPQMDESLEKLPSSFLRPSSYRRFPSSIVLPVFFQVSPTSLRARERSATWQHCKWGSPSYRPACLPPSRSILSPIGLFHSLQVVIYSFCFVISGVTHLARMIVPALQSALWRQLTVSILISSLHSLPTLDLAPLYADDVTDALPSA